MIAVIYTPSHAKPAYDGDPVIARDRVIGTATPKVFFGRESTRTDANENTKAKTFNTEEQRH